MTELKEIYNYLKELATPDGYVPNSEVSTIILDNTPTNSGTERVFQYTTEVENLLLGGFKLDKTVNWKTEEGTETEKIPVADVTFKLYKGTTAEGELIATLKTDEAGQISYRLEAGDYTLVEDMSSGLYAKDPEQFAESGEDSDGNWIDTNGNIHIRVTASEINESFTKEEGLTVNNIAKYGRFQLAKKT